MENIDSYLHKKFKKQVNVDAKIQNDKENKNVSYTEQNEEKIEKKENHNQVDHHLYEIERFDNKDSVPNQSTNSSSFTVNANFVKSSISVGNQQPSNSYISYVVSKQFDHQPVSFDTKFKPQTNYLDSTSSILDTVYPTQNYKYTEETYIPYTRQDEYSSRTEEISGVKHEEIQPTPDKNTNGKYVCPYCNLVCSKPSVLQKHIRAHTNERPYPCESCGFSFKTRSNLYKHCRSRTHANRLMGSKTQEATSEIDTPKTPTYSPNYITSKEEQQKPYKPRFHTTKIFDNTSTENTEEEPISQNNPASEFVTHQINELIDRNNLVVNSNNQFSQKEFPQLEFRYNKEPVYERPTEEPLNLTNKNRKRSLSEVSEPVIQKSLIKELLLKNLSSSDMQCPYCKMIFQTVTELDVHKYRSCKGKPSGAKYTRSSSVNVASILTHNKNAFDNIPQMQNTVFPLNSPGPFLGKTRLIDGDKTTKSFSFDSGHLPLMSPGEPSPSPNYLLSPIPFEKDRKSKIKLFGGEVKVHSSGETKSFKIDGKDDKFEQESNYIDYGSKLSENRVVKTSLQSGGTVLTNNTNYKQEIKTPQEVMMISPNIDIGNYNKSRFTFEKPPEMGTERVQDMLAQSSEILKSPKSYPDESSPLYKNIMDFSQKAIKMLTPNIRPPIFPTSTRPIFNNINRENKGESKVVNTKPKLTETNYLESTQPNLYNPLNLYVNGKVVRHVPGMPGPVVAAETSEYSSKIVAVAKPSPQPTTPLTPLIIDRPPSRTKSNDNHIEKAADRVLFLQPEKVPERPIKSPNNIQNEKNNKTTNNFLQPEKISERLSKSPKLDNADLGSKNIANKIGEQKINEVKSMEEIKKFARPNSLALKPTMASLKQHHGLTPTMFNQILISPDTPRVAKKYAEHFLHGNYFSYLGLKSSTRPVYCTLNKTQPFYVPFFKKLSMYSEWRQQDTKQDKLYASQYDSRQNNPRYTVAGKTSADLIIHSSYKFVISETSSHSEKEDEPQKSNPILGGYESNDDYIYVRGRGRGRYVCDQCGIRCKKPSMLKKHIRTHSNDRPYTCSHCNFSFKTKGNLTKHMKSKAHSKNSTHSNGSSSSSAQQSAQSSDSDTDDSGMDSSDESTRQQEHEAAYGLLSLSQKPSQASEADRTQLHTGPSETFMTTEDIAHFSKSNYAKNKILDDPNSTRNSFNSTDLEKVNNAFAVTETSESHNVRTYLGMGSINRPLTYPYTSILSVEKEALPSPKGFEVEPRIPERVSGSPEVKSIKQFHVIQKYTSQPKISPKISEISVRETVPRKTEYNYSTTDNVILNNVKNVTTPNRPLPTLKINDVVVTNDNVSDIRKRKFPVTEPPFKNKLQRNDEVIDLSMANNQEKVVNGLGEERILNNCRPLESHKDDNIRLTEPKKNVDNFRPLEPQKNIDCRPVETQKNVANEIFNTLHKVPSQRFEVNEEQEDNLVYKPTEPSNNNGTVIILRPLPTEEQVNINYHDVNNEESIKSGPYDNSAMETLADIATKQVKLEKNTLAKSVASEFLKLATKNENMDGCRDSVSFGPVNKDVNEIMVKSEGNKSCTICSKSFNKPSQLRLHMNIHYLERPFRCDSCSVSFRTKGHLQKHERSASHHNKLSSSPALSSSEPRPFKCSDCSIAFRIHGHLAKHLRSKMHIQKLECLAKIPFGLYAELERSNSLLTEINTCDGDQCLESLKTLAKKVFVNDPNKLNQLEPRENISAD